MPTLLFLLPLALNDVQCEGCGFWYDLSERHVCVPC